MNKALRVLFFRDYRHFAGGHLKVWHYFCHLKEIEGYDPRIYFSPDSLWGDSNPWKDDIDRVSDRWAPADDADLLFIAGLDWLQLDNGSPKKTETPIINLIQSVRHALPEDPRYRFLSRQAVRICVSEEVRDAIAATGLVNGPLFTIPNGVDIEPLYSPLSRDMSSADILVVAQKNPEFGRDLAHSIKAMTGSTADLLTDFLPRQEFLRRLRNAKVIVLLPCREEGFYLPAIEAMALGAIVVCPDVIGNRSYCKDSINCFFPDYQPPSVADAVVRAISLTEEARAKMIGCALETAALHSLRREQDMFRAVLAEIPHA